MVRWTEERRSEIRFVFGEQVKSPAAFKEQQQQQILVTEIKVDLFFMPNGEFGRKS